MLSTRTNRFAGFREVRNERRTETIDELFPGLAPARTAADGDHVVVRWRVRGTHLGAGLGMPATAAARSSSAGMTGSPSATASSSKAGIRGTWATASIRSSEGDNAPFQH